MSKPVETTISYWRDPGDGSGPDTNYCKELLLGHRDEDKHKITVRDIRGIESVYALDIHGFEIRKLSSKERDITDQEAVKREYYNEISNLIKEITGAKEVALFGQIIRAYQRDALAPHEFIPENIQGPSPRAHVDVSPEGAEGAKGAKGFTGLVPGAADMISTASRWQILGIWKPVKPIHRDPLAFTDSRSVPDSDYRDLVGPKHIVSLLKFGGEREHRWYYCSDMTPDEVVVLKHFDSKKDIPARRCAHTSIALPGTENLPARESIEVRALVCF